jgi:hypothetical protein
MLDGKLQKVEKQDLKTEEVNSLSEACRIEKMHF